MAKPSKGKKALKSSQKAVKEEKAVAPEPVVVQAVQAEKPKKDTPVAEQASAVPADRSSIVDKAVHFVKSNLTIYTIAIVLLMGLMLYLRVVPPHDAVFTNWPWLNGSTYVNIAADDGVYHMRLLNNLLQHFPFRILYDPFTHFPYGNTIHFGPLFELIPAAFLLIAGLGNPGQLLTDSVAAYYPAVLGMLVIIPVYYIAKKLFGRPAGLVAAVAIAFMPGAFFYRSILGSFDHHVAEVLFMACTVACMVYALDAAKKSNVSLEQIKNKDWGSLKMLLIYGALAGIFLGCYLLSWVGALLLAFTLFVYFTLQAFIDDYKGRSLDYLVVLAALVFLIPTLMVLPYAFSNLSFSAVYYSLTQPLLFIFAFLGVCVEYSVARVLKESKAEKWTFPVAIVGITVIALILVDLIIPNLFGILQYSLTQLVPSGGTLTIAEAYPTFLSRTTGGYSFDTVWQNYYWTFPAAILGLILLIINVFRSQRPGEIMFLVWNLVMTWALVAQNRFTYYWGVNAALLTAYLAYQTFQMLDLDKYWADFKKKVNGMENFQRFLKKNTGSTIAVVFVVLVFALIAVYPALPMSDATGANSEGVLFQTASSGASTLPYEWYDALMWMRSHTPDPQGNTISPTFNYASGQYYKDPANKTYDYPSSAYGVMSWWDYGHDIEYVAQRIPNANPFQAGIIEENGTTGASPFFCSTDENQSVKMLDEVGGRYVAIDNQMASGKFYAIQTWIGDTGGWESLVNSTYLYSDGSSMYQTQDTVPILQDTAKWDNSIMNRLYYEDADNMSHYRLVYESAGAYYVNMKVINRNTGYAGFNNPLSFNNLDNATQIYNLYGHFVVATDSRGTLYGYDARPPAKFVKIFEKVDGATLTGSAPEGSNVTATLTLKTDQGRTFNYTASTVAQNGYYSFVVPYPTELMKGDGYSYGIMPQTKYVITYGNTTKSVDVPESAVMSGSTVQIT
ncbi:MAG TPA: oligosaccharyl transferase, archaeosortase A system-associated [Methanocella sp.]|uniref:oligosaccharyl transferase, archaeosortase A system-associated n=1 Tax=Methanocella sp. TaxID=2052833 RepID=UPI002C4794E3|nr:oligosaccharyl transferase, archaeosortase A system-associated [Methanocella sp.]HTY91613.1 oligosaccharyl transferase, archaeosortase A system-associated [Methanocella sp.]